MLRGLGIGADLTTLQSGEKAGNSLKEGGLFLVMSDSDAEEIAKLIKSLDVEDESEPPTEDIPQPEEDVPEDSATPGAAVSDFAPLRPTY